MVRQFTICDRCPIPDRISKPSLGYPKEMSGWSSHAADGSARFRSSQWGMGSLRIASIIVVIIVLSFVAARFIVFFVIFFIRLFSNYDIAGHPTIIWVLIEVI